MLNMYFCQGYLIYFNNFKKEVKAGKILTIVPLDVL